MKCPACGHENSGVTVRCASCNHLFDASKAPSPPVTAKVSRLAVASAVCILLSPLFPMILAATFIFFDGVLHPGAGNHVDVATGVVLLSCEALLVMGFVLGLISLARISLSHGRLTGRGFAVTGTVVPLVLGSLVLVIYIQEAKRYASHYPMICGANLSQIGKAAIIYANDYDDKLPRTGGDGTIWGPGLNDWTASSRTEVFGLDPNGSGGQATISSSFYLLVKYAGVPLKLFVCRGDRQTKEFTPRKYGMSDKELTALWDFGPNPSKHCSYAYHVPYGQYAITTSSSPGMVIAADRNPWIDAPRQNARDFSLFKPDHRPFKGTEEEACQGNTRAHENEGQNVLFLDSHVEFTKRSYRGLDDDNIYTAWDGDDSIRGIPPKPYESQPADARDSLLVNDPPQGR